MSGSEIDFILADFRRWLMSLAPEPEISRPEPPAIDLSTVLGHYVALRQEVNLQTRSVRAQQEQSGETLESLQQAAPSSLRRRKARRAASNWPSKPRKNV